MQSEARYGVANIIVFDQAGRGSIYIPRPHIDWKNFQENSLSQLRAAMVIKVNLGPKKTSQLTEAYNHLVSDWENLLRPYFIIATIPGLGISKIVRKQAA